MSFHKSPSYMTWLSVLTHTKPNNMFPTKMPLLTTVSVETVFPCNQHSTTQQHHSQNIDSTIPKRQTPTHIYSHAEHIFFKSSQLHTHESTGAWLHMCHHMQWKTVHRFLSLYCRAQNIHAVSSLPKPAYSNTWTQQVAEHRRPLTPGPLERAQPIPARLSHHLTP